MTRRAIALTAAVVAVIALLPFEHAAADPPPTEGALAIAGYDADAFRSDAGALSHIMGSSFPPGRLPRPFRLWGIGTVGCG